VGESKYRPNQLYDIDKKSLIDRQGTPVWKIPSAKLSVPQRLARLERVLNPLLRLLLAAQ
jgi:hypothetical protein